MATIVITQGRMPAKNPGGITVVIDVIRAFTVCHVAFEQGVEQISLARDVQTALQIRTNARMTSYLAGEIKALPIDGFDFGNSPFEISQRSLTGAQLILKTTNGVEATLNCSDTKQVLVAGYRNAASTANYIADALANKQFDCVQLVASHPTGDEDLACAEHMRDIIMGRSDISARGIEDRIRHCENAKKFFDPKQPLLSPLDIDYCVNVPQQQFIMFVEYDQTPVIKAKAA